MGNKLLKIVKKLKRFTIDDLIMFSDIEEDKILEFIKNCENIKQVGNSFEYVEKTTTKNSFQIIDKNVECKNSNISAIEAINIYIGICKSKNLKQKTISAYRTFCNAHIIPYFKNSLLKDISITDIQKFQKCMQKKNISERRIKNILTLLNQIIKHFQNEGYVKKSCVFEVKRLDQIPKREVPILTPYQLKQLFKILKSEYPYLLLIVEKLITIKQPLNAILTGNEQEKERSKRKIRNDFYKVKQNLGLENYMIDDLRFCKDIPLGLNLC